MSNGKKNTYKEFNRVNVFQVGIIPLHFTLLICFSKIFQNFVRIDIPINMFRGIYPGIIHVFLIAPSSFWNVVYLILFFLTLCIFLSFLDYIDFQLCQKIFGKKAKPGRGLSGFSIFCVISIFIYHIFNTTMTIPVQEYMFLLEEGIKNNVTGIQQIFEYLIRGFFILPFFLQLFPCEMVYKVLRSIGLFLITLLSNNTHKDIPAEQVEKVFNSSGKMDVIQFFLLRIDPNSWKSGWLIFKILRVFYFSFLIECVAEIRTSGALGFIILMLVIFIFILILLDVVVSLYVNEVELFCEAVSLDPKNEKAWLDEYHKTLEFSNRLESEINTIKKSKKEIQLYKDALIHLFLLLGKDRAKADYVAHIIKHDIQKESFKVSSELSAMCQTTVRKCFIEGNDRDRLITADKSMFENMLRQILIYSEKNSPSESPIIFKITSEENNDCVINCTFAVDSSMVNEIQDTFEFLQFAEIALSQKAYDNAETLCIAQLYAAVNEMVITYELINKQLFCLKIIPV